MHRRASAWFEEHGLLDEALHHALAAGDLDLAARQMNAGLRDVLNREDRPTLERWLRLLPEEMIQQHPELLMIKVWALQFSWRLDLQAQVLQQVEELLDSEMGASLPANDLQILRGQILLLRAQQAYFSNQTTQAIDLCRQALALLPSIVDIRARRGDVLPGLVHASQRPGSRQPNGCCSMNMSLAAIRPIPMPCSSCNHWVSSTSIPASLSRPGKLRRCCSKGQPAAGWQS